MGEPISVLVAEDEDLVRRSFRVLIDLEPGMRTVGEARTGKEAVTLALELRPQVVLMDIRMPEMDGLEATKAISASESAARVIMLTTFDQDEFIYGALRVGASGYLLKNSSPEDLVRAIHVVAAGDALLAPQITRRLISDVARDRRRTSKPSVRPPDLTVRELEIVSLVALGRSNEEIAEELCLSKATIKSYISRVLTRLHVRDRAQVVIFAYESGIVTPGQSA